MSGHPSPTRCFMPFRRTLPWFRPMWTKKSIVH